MHNNCVTGTVFVSRAKFLMMRFESQLPAQFGQSIQKSGNNLPDLKPLLPKQCYQG